ncbi:MAG: SDR family oxidoreductase [Chloroflexi bacterium]|nr:SDR family oxidoreductase [Chloroflexota bacterium]
MKLAGKITVVTGAGSGIGQAIAQTLAAAGARIAVVDFSETGGQETVRLITEQGGEAFFVQADVSHRSDVERYVKAVVERYGRIDILCNNAGIGVAATVTETTEEDWDRVLAVDLKGVYLGCKYTIPVMLRQGGGVIVNTASVAGMVGVLNRAAYCAAKAGVVGLTKSIAVDYVSQNIRCNAVCPGTVDSPWIQRILSQQPDPVAERQRMVERQPMGRMGRPDEVARAVLYLACDDSAFVTGSTLVIDGGLTAR